MFIWLIKWFRIFFFVLFWNHLKSLSTNKPLLLNEIYGSHFQINKRKLTTAFFAGSPPTTLRHSRKICIFFCFVCVRHSSIKSNIHKLVQFQQLNKVRSSIAISAKSSRMEKEKRVHFECRALPLSIASCVKWIGFVIHNKTNEKKKYLSYFCRTKSFSMRTCGADLFVSHSPLSRV